MKIAVELNGNMSIKGVVVDIDKAKAILPEGPVILEWNHSAKSNPEFIIGSASNFSKGIEDMVCDIEIYKSDDFPLDLVKNLIPSISGVIRSRDKLKNIESYTVTSVSLGTNNIDPRVKSIGNQLKQKIV